MDTWKKERIKTREDVRGDETSDDRGITAV